MKDYTEKRAGKRCNYEAAVTCTYFNSDRFYRAKTTNHSSGGLYFESTYPFKPGSTIFIRVENYTREASVTKICGCGGIPHISLAEVKWCRERPGTNDSHYRVGLKYLEPGI